jgi:DNA invertase Pin-like site-specific DNA recombinase
MQAAHNSNSATVRCALYGRVSTRDKGQDTENQLVQLREFAARQRWQIVAEYVDRESGATANRAEFQSMFQDASQCRFDVLLFWSLDRLSREGVLETLQHLNRLTSYGVAWRSFTEQYLDSTGVFRDAVIGILAVIAKQERIRLSERTRAGLERARRNGKTLGRPRVNLDTARIRQLRKEGMSYQKIATALHTSVGSVFSASWK